MSKTDKPADAVSLSEAGKTAKKPVPGHTVFSPQAQKEDPRYVVVFEPVFFGKTYDVGEELQHPGKINPLLGSPGRCLKPVGHTGPWPPVAYVEAQEKKQNAAQKEGYLLEKLRELTQ